MIAATSSTRGIFFGRFMVDSSGITWWWGEEGSTGLRGVGGGRDEGGEGRGEEEGRDEGRGEGR